MEFDKLLVHSIAVIILSIIAAFTYTVNQPNELECVGVFVGNSNKEMLLADCFNPCFSRGDTTYMVKVVFKE